MGRTVIIKCNDDVVADSRLYSYGITSGKLKLGIDDNIPQLEFTIAETQSGYDRCVLGGDVKVYFDDTLKFRGRLDEIDVDKDGNKTIVANGDIARLKSCHYGDGSDQWYYSTLINKAIAEYNTYCQDGPAFSVNYIWDDETRSTEYSDRIYSASAGSTVLECIAAAAGAANDNRLHYWVEPTEDDTRVLTFASCIWLYAGYYKSSTDNNIYTSGYDKRYSSKYLKANSQKLVYGYNITDIDVEKTVPAATVYEVSATDYSGNAIDVTGLPIQAYVFSWNGTRWNYVSTVTDAPTNVPEYGLIYGTADCGQMPVDGTQAKYCAYFAAMQILGVNTDAKTIKATGVDMHYVDGSDEISPYKPITVVSEKHGVDDFFMINEITYNLLDPTDTQVSVGTEESLITR